MTTKTNFYSELARLELERDQALEEVASLAAKVQELTEANARLEDQLGTLEGTSALRGERAEAAESRVHALESALRERQENLWIAGWREGWEAAKLSPDRIPHIHDAVEAAASALASSSGPDDAKS